MMVTVCAQTCVLIVGHDTGGSARCLAALLVVEAGGVRVTRGVTAVVQQGGALVAGRADPGVLRVDGFQVRTATPAALRRALSRSEFK